MKQELPFAIALLAAGCLLCFSQFSGPANSTHQFDATFADLGTDDLPIDNWEAQQQPSDSIPAFDVPDTLTDSHPTDVAQASFDEIIPDKTTQRPKNSLFKFVHSASDPKAIEFLAKVSKRVADSQPLSSSIQMTGNLFGEVVSATGNYYQLGQGSSKSRIELNFGMLPNSPRVFQLCDGRFVYKLQTEGKQRSFEFVDLMRIREAAGEKGTGITPTGWVATGGVASLFQHLASAFNFGAPESIGESKVVLRGSWDPKALIQVLRSNKPEFRPDNLPLSNSDWARVPSQLPHAVELVFQTDPELEFFPQRVSFLKFKANKSKSNPKNQHAFTENPTPTVTMVFSAPQALNDSAEQFFVINSSNQESIDVTEQYIARINTFDETLQANTESPTVER